MSDDKKLRITLFDHFEESTDENAYCKKSNLSNEASVETFFVNRLLEDLGYEDHQIQTKKAISQIIISLGSRKIHYKPDYVITYKKVPRLVIDAKSTTERLTDWIEQCSGYCLSLNKRHSESNPVEFFVLTNGLHTIVYKWDEEDPVLELDFSDFNHGSPKYEKFRKLLSLSEIDDSKKLSSVIKADFVFEKPSTEVAKRVFSQCHTIIWKSEGYGRTAAFMEFTKLMFVKLWADKKLRSDKQINSMLYEDGIIKIPKASVTFSKHWIEANEISSNNPINDILFKTLRDAIEIDIVNRKKKRIFEEDEIIDLKPTTIKSVVSKIQNYDMYGIDEDLNGRLFETFLSATMRGKELGQYFTPRSVVKLVVKMADLQITRLRMDTVLDACCGTGGFLIEALSEMRNKIRNNASMGRSEKENLMEKLSNEAIYGIDFGKNPPIARIARINMYLHGDGGSRIYYADALDKFLIPTMTSGSEVLENQNELKKQLEKIGGFDVVMTNPPFSMTKELKDEDQAEILKQYELSKIPKTKRYRSSLRSSAMFIERYRDLLRPGGRFFTVIDDTLLASDDFKYVRNFIRNEFIIRAIISLPGDAFRRSGARVKTSILCLERKKKLSDEQPDVFIAFSYQLGIDDLTPRAPSHEINEARNKANMEIAKISSDFHKFLNGDSNVMTVSAGRISKRFDLKYVVPSQGRYVQKWKKEGYDVKKLNDVLVIAEDEITPKQYPDEDFTLIKVSYSGICEPTKITKGKYINPNTMKRLHAGDLVFSKIRSTDGAIGIVPEELEGSLVSQSFVVLRGENLHETVYIWSFMRTHEIRADMMSVSTGTGRYTTDWEQAKEIQIPWLDEGKRKEIAEGFLEAENLKRKIKELENKSLMDIERFGVESQESKERFESYRPPK